MSIGSRLKDARIGQKLTQEELARAVGVTKGAIGNYETGVSSPKEPVLIKLMEVLNIDANYIYQDYVTFENNANIALAPSAAESELLSLYRSLNADGQSLVMITARTCAGNPAMQKDAAGASAM